jgi:hypothetical protein
VAVLSLVLRLIANLILVGKLSESVEAKAAAHVPTSGEL